MSTVRQLWPNATILTDDITLGGGAADADDALRRAGPSSLWKADWVELTSLPFTGDSLVRVGLDDLSPALEATQRIARLRIVAFARTFAGGTVRWYGSLFDVGGTEVQNFYKNTDLGDAGVLVIGTWQTTRPTGGEWTETTVNNLQLKMKETHAGGAYPRIYWAYVEADIFTRAQTTIVSPAEGGLVDIIEQLVQWNVAADGDAPYRYQVKMFSKAVAEGGGFDPETSSAEYDSGPQAATQQQHAFTTFVGYNSEHYFYVKNSTIFPGPTANEEWWGPWAGQRVKTISLPVITVSLPTGTIATSQPTVTWSYTDVDNKLMDTWLVRIYARPGGSWAGFDPDAVSSVPVWWTYVAGTAPHTVTPPTAVLQNATNYRAYVKGWVADRPYATSQNSSDFATLFVPPNTPSVFVFDDDANANNILAVQGHDNLLTANQSSLETNTTGWAANSNCTIARSTAQFAHGVASLEMTATAGGDMSAVTPGGTGGIPVASGQTYTVRARSRANTTGRTVEFFVRWYTAAGAAITSNSVIITDNNGGFTEGVVNGVIAPGTAAFAAIEVWVRSAAAAEKHYVDMIGFFPGTATEAPWSVGGQNATMFVQRSVDGGLTWQDVRNAKNLVGGISQAVVPIDYEAALNVATQYRVSAVSTSTGFPAQSPWGLSNIVTLDTKVLWLKDPLDPTKNMHTISTDKFLDRTVRRARTFYEPLTRTKPVPMRGSVNAENLNANFLTKTIAEENKLKALLESDHTLFFQTPRGSWYVDLTSDYHISEYLWSDKHSDPVFSRLFNVPFTEVDPVPVI